jgi:hypothetical protein
MLKIIGYIVGFSILIAAIVGYLLYSKKVAPLDHMKPDFILTADALYDAFELDESEANLAYIGKVIDVKGEVSDIQELDSTWNIMLKAENAISDGINCSFVLQPDSEISVGTSVTVRGRCQGFLMDVILNNCTLIKDALP